MKNSLNNLPFADFVLNRNSSLRGNEEFWKEKINSQNAQLLIFRGLFPFLEKKEMMQSVLFHPSILQNISGKKIGPFYLGDDENGLPYFAVSFSENSDFSILEGLGFFDDLKKTAFGFEFENLSITGYARGLLDWHYHHQYCANCGHQSEIKDFGFRRECEYCKTSHFPRTDPVVIMNIIKDDKCLLGCGVNFPDGFYSALAGFVEPGETLEQACKREAFEEAGAKITSAKIIGNQPWPFPSQLMIGLNAYAESFEINIDSNELKDAKWFTKEEAKALIFGGLNIDGKMHYGPRKIAIAHYLLLDFINS